MLCENKVKLELAICVLEQLDSFVPIEKAPNVVDVIVALASHASDQDPWTTQQSYAASRTVLEGFVARVRAESDNSFWSLIERLLTERIKPLFAKTKNPAITEAGRKNFHPVPLPRFDASIIDPETKPWKIQSVYATTLLSWVIAQYQVCFHHPKDLEFSP